MLKVKPKPVPIPEGGRIRIQKNKYVYWYDESKWDNEKKQTIDNRVSIGQLDPDNPGMIIPNKNYYTIFTNIDDVVLKKVKDIEYSQENTQNVEINKENIDEKSNEINNNLNIDIPEPGAQSRYIGYGLYIAMYTATCMSGCLQALKDTFQRYWKFIFAIAIKAIESSNFVAQRFPGWYFKNYCGLENPLSSPDISNLFLEIGKDQDSVDNFFEKFKTNYTHEFNKNDELVVSFDSTTINTHSQNNKYAEYGHPKDNEGLPNSNFAMFVDQITSIPIYMEHFFGSLLDKSQSPFTLEKVEDLGFKKLMFMMDRGYFTKEDLKVYANYKFGIMCPDNLTFVKDTIAKYGNLINDNHYYYIDEYDVYGIHKKNVEIFDDKLDVYLYYDANTQRDEVNMIHSKIKKMKELLKKEKNYSEELNKKYKPWFSIEKIDKRNSAGQNFVFEENKYKIQEMIDVAGYFVIVSNSGYSLKKMIKTAKERDKGEKAFRRLKSAFDLDKTGTHNDMTYKGKMFVAFVALIIIESYRWFIKDILNKTSSTTTATTIDELNKYEIFKKNDNSYMPLYAMTKKQKEIFNCLNLSEEDVIKSVRKLSL